ncbi:MAG TPA: hypothetical protein DDW17_01700 [Deltaproteobacteria bacterium]|nr:hypothetical protein [Deltaproteobacteria bacterium]
MAQFIIGIVLDIIGIVLLIYITSVKTMNELVIVLLGALIAFIAGMILTTQGWRLVSRAKSTR